MDYPVVMVCESNDWLANLLRVRTSQRPWVLRQVRDLVECRAVCRRVGRAVLVIGLNEVCPARLEMIAWAHEHRPKWAVIGVSETRHLGETGFLVTQAAWSAGADYVMSRDDADADLLPIVDAFLNQQWNEALLHVPNAGNPGT